MMHFIPLDAYGTQDISLQNAAVSACHLRTEVVDFDGDGKMVLYGPQDIFGPVTIKPASEVPEIVRLGYRKPPSIPLPSLDFRVRELVSTEIREELSQKVLNSIPRLSSDTFTLENVKNET
jgi:hypothetical protein